MQKPSFYKFAAFGLLFLLAFWLEAGAIVAQDERLFDSPELAIQALAAALKQDKPQELYSILGSRAGNIIESGDPVTDHADRVAFADAYEKKHALILRHTEKGERYILEIGEDAWPFPVPLIKDASGRWFFDAKEGEDEIISRRIGHNELAAMQVCQVYVDAQKEYFLLNPNHARRSHYASQITSRPDIKDGLYWPTGPGEPESPFGALAAEAESAGYNAQQSPSAQPVPYYGYHYRILTGQNKFAPGGARSYMDQGLMTGGFALLAYPAKYGVSGVMTFMIGEDGVLYEKNLGKGTSSKAARIALFSPDNTWKKVDIPNE